MSASNTKPDAAPASAIDEYLAAHPGMPVADMPGLVVYLASIRPEERLTRDAENRRVDPTYDAFMARIEKRAAAFDRMLERRRKRKL